MDAGIRLLRALRLLLIAAFVVQCTAVQTHVHFAQLASRTSISAWSDVHGQAEKLFDPQIATAPDSCPLCWEAAMAGHYLSPAADGLALPPAIGAWIVVPALLEFGLRPSSHRWLSRAPPQ